MQSVRRLDVAQLSFRAALRASGLAQKSVTHSSALPLARSAASSVLLGVLGVLGGFFR
jgi:hypothetical protein